MDLFVIRTFVIYSDQNSFKDKDDPLRLRDSFVNQPRWILTMLYNWEVLQLLEKSVETQQLSFLKTLCFQLERYAESRSAPTHTCLPLGCRGDEHDCLHFGVCLTIPKLAVEGRSTDNYNCFIVSVHPFLSPPLLLLTKKRKQYASLLRSCGPFSIFAINCVLFRFWRPLLF